MQGETIFVAVNSDGAQAKFRGRAKDADGDLGAVGDQQLVHGFLVRSDLPGFSENFMAGNRQFSRCKPAVLWGEWAILQVAPVRVLSKHVKHKFNTDHIRADLLAAEFFDAGA